MLYAKKILKYPTKSPVYEQDLIIKAELAEQRAEQTVVEYPRVKIAGIVTILMFLGMIAGVVPYGRTEPYHGTHPIAFAAPGAHGEPLMFDMATTVQAWGKILDKKSKNEPIPSDWAVDENKEPTTDPHKVNALVPIAGPKGYGLMIMVDVLSGILLGVPFGKHVSSMYHDLSEGRNLGQLHIVINPEKFKEDMSASLKELTEIKPAPGFDRVYYLGERGKIREQESNEKGIEVVDEIYEYLISDDIHFNRYDGKNRFAE